MLGPIIQTSSYFEFAPPSSASAGLNERARAEKERWSRMEFILEQTAKRKGSTGVASPTSPRSSFAPHLRPQHHQHRRHQSEDYRHPQPKHRSSPPTLPPNPALLDSTPTTLYSTPSFRSSSGPTHHAGMMVGPSPRTPPTSQPSAALSKTITGVNVHTSPSSTAAITGTTHTNKLKEAGTAASLGSSNAYTRGPIASTTTTTSGMGMGTGSTVAMVGPPPPFSSGFGSHQQIHKHQHQPQSLSIANSKASSGPRHNIGHRQTRSASGLNLGSLGPTMSSSGTMPSTATGSSVLYQTVPASLVAAGKGSNKSVSKPAVAEDAEEPFLFYSSDGKLPKGIAVPTGMSLTTSAPASASAVSNANVNGRRTPSPPVAAPTPIAMNAGPPALLPPLVVTAARRNMHKRSQSSLDSIPEEEGA
ncbi:hypothetical protein BDN72DRAFT_431769 [Pluteus cervinus]|uniref:Uncharacterized protein n=1 Tax=Pluteus cervinus TaxID=181527 RepID=A0ACD3B3I8_9AGAR|nr:hypothetical protein BDN72DRAFT_431769 [Pluteus cervinus]